MLESTAIIVDFLNSVGIPVRQGQVPSDSFLPGLRVVDGGLVYDPDALRWPGDLLHEGGHIATVPAAVRPSLNDSLDAAPESPHGGEAEATAWAFAALAHLGLPLSLLFHDGGYHGKSPSLILTYSMGVYPGAHGLVQAGLTLANADSGVAPYPHMIRWLRD